MKVVHLNTARSRGGAAYMASILVQGLSRCNDVDALLVHGQYVEEDSLFVGVQGDIRRYVNAALFRIFGTPKIGVYAQSKLNKLISDSDVLHLHNLHGYWLDYFKILQGIKKPVVWTWHDMWPVTGRCGFSLDCDLWKTGCRECPHKEYYPATLSSSSAAEYLFKSEMFEKNSNILIVTPCRWMKEIALERGLPENRVHIVSNPVDTNAFTIRNSLDCRKKLNIDEFGNYLLFVASDCNDDRKGYSFYEEIIEKTGSKGIVVGKPPKTLHPSVEYRGVVTNREEVSLCYSASDCMVVPSLEDNFPNTVLESMASGVPVFGFAVGGIPSQLPDEWDGLVSKEDVTMLYEKISTFLIKGDEEKLDIGKMIRKKVVDNSSVDVVVKKYYELYLSLLSQNV